MASYKHFKMGEVVDWEGESWDIYDEKKNLAGIPIYRGWPYGLTPRDGIGGQFRTILTNEIAEFLKVHSITEAENLLGLSNSMVAKFRRWLGIQRKVFYKDNAWLLAHQDELLFDTLASLKEKYGLNRNQVYQHRIWLATITEVPTKKKLRKTQAELKQEQWFQENKEQLATMTAQDIAQQYQLSLFVAKRIYNRLRLELDEPNFSERHKLKKQAQQQWLLEHEQELLHSGKSIAILAQELQRTTGQILRAKAKLREKNHTPKVKDQNRAWLREHQALLLGIELDNKEIAKRLNITPAEVSRRKTQLRRLFNLPSHLEQIHEWRQQHQELLLSLDLPIREIARRLNRSEQFIIKVRSELRKTLGITVKD